MHTNDTTKTARMLHQNGAVVTPSPERRSHTHEDVSPYYVEITRGDLAPFGDDHDGSLPLTPEARTLLPIIETFLIAVDYAAGSVLGSLEGRDGRNWRMAMTMLSRPYEDSRLAGCLYGLKVLMLNAAAVADIGGDLRAALVEAQPNVSKLRYTQGTLVDNIPMLAEYMHTDEGRAHVARLIEEAKGEGYSHA